MMNKVFASNRNLAALAMLAPSQVGAVSMRSFASKKSKKSTEAESEIHEHVPKASRFEGFEISSA